jgi:RNA polymerase sigma-70 factor (ECF subfamily)
VTTVPEPADTSPATARIETLRHMAATDPAAMEELLGLLSPYLLGRCSKFLPCRADAEEAAQDALLVVATRLTTFADRGSFLGWVTVIASNCARRTYRSLKRRWSEQSGHDLSEVPDTRTTSVLAGSRLDLLDALDALERRHPQLVAPVVLRDLGSLSYAEVAAQTGLPLGTVKSQIHEARAFLRRRLDDHS